MNQFNKKEMLKSYILEDKVRFELAVDVYENFISISDDILRFVSESPIKLMNDKNGWNLEIIGLDKRSNYYYFKIMLNQNFYLEFECRYYFKTNAISLGDKASPCFDPKNNEHIIIRELMKKEFSTTVEFPHYISYVKINNDGLNVGGSFIDLFEVYKRPDILKNFCDNFIERFEGIISRILYLLNSIHEEPKANVSSENTIHCCPK